MSQADDHRRGPRRRGAALESAIFDAVLAELRERGYAGLSIDAVADRARVSKASLYRRWPGRAELVVAAVHALLPDPTTLPDTGTLRGDLLATFRDLADRLSGPSGDALRGLVAEALHDGAASEVFHARRPGRGADIVRELVGRAQARGEVAAAAISPRRLEVGHAMARHEFLVTGTVSDRFVTELVDEVLLPLLGAPGGRPGVESPPGEHRREQPADELLAAQDTGRLGHRRGAARPTRCRAARRARAGPRRPRPRAARRRAASPRRRGRSSARTAPPPRRPPPTSSARAGTQ